MIYFIHAVGTNYVKIGVTGDSAEDRLRSLQTGCPHKLVLLATCAGDENTEKQLHTRFRHLRRNGEWFELCEELRFLLMRQVATEQLANLDAELSFVKREVQDLKSRLFNTLESMDYLLSELTRTGAIHGHRMLSDNIDGSFEYTGFFIEFSSEPQRDNCNTIPTEGSDAARAPRSSPAGAL